eukprot:TRINITY_DN32922_c0_g1_i1.p1 TRINITY_DN32922_c0_g1~~TRINITY_DN32922_c0_g1_i1.p1  ORF type:complete len:442 (+),score=93.75 TRINITY_DN32922_c0_g1_i1:176-1501(+)
MPLPAVLYSAAAAAAQGAPCVTSARPLHNPGCTAVARGGSGFSAWCFREIPARFHEQLQYSAPRAHNVSGLLASQLCLPRLVADQGQDTSVPFSVVAERARSLVCCGRGSLWFRRYGPMRPPELLPPDQGHSEPWGPGDFPTTVLRLRHRCSHATRRQPHARTCWRTAVGPNGTYRHRLGDSLVAVWGPPKRDTNSMVITARAQCYDPLLHLLMRPALDREPGLFLDLGANLGYMSLYALAMGHRVLAFEANPVTRRKLALSLWLSHGLGVRAEVVPGGTVPFVSVDGNYGGSHIASAADGPAGAAGAVRVPLTTVDAELEARGLFADSEGREPVLIKLDIEGQELPALQGAARTLHRWHPWLVIETCQPRAFRSGTAPASCAPPEPLFAYLRDAGYSCATSAAAAQEGRWDVGAVLKPRRRSETTANVVCAAAQSAAPAA